MPEFWLPVIIGSLAVYTWKIFGYVLPKKIAKNREVVIFASKLTIALLAALTAVQALSTGQQIVFDSRVPAMGLAAILFWRKAPFLVAVAAAAVLATCTRYFLNWA